MGSQATPQGSVNATKPTGKFEPKVTRMATAVAFDLCETRPGANAMRNISIAQKFPGSKMLVFKDQFGNYQAKPERPNMAARGILAVSNGFDKMKVASGAFMGISAGIGAILVLKAVGIAVITGLALATPVLNIVVGAVLGGAALTALGLWVWGKTASKANLKTQNEVYQAYRAGKKAPVVDGSVDSKSDGDASMVGASTPAQEPSATISKTSSQLATDIVAADAETPTTPGTPKQPPVGPSSYSMISDERAETVAGILAAA